LLEIFQWMNKDWLYAVPLSKLDINIIHEHTSSLNEIAKILHKLSNGSVHMAP